MLNEGVYRSPKWLRKFMDYEVSTGDDIKGKKSKKSIRLEEEKKKKEILKKWDNKWKNIDPVEFREFFKEVYPKETLRYFSGYVSSYDLPKIEKEYRGDFIFLKKFDKWKSDKVKKEQEHERVKKELDDLFKYLVDDFSSNQYNDKYETSRENGNVCFIYTFENGDDFKMCDNKITYKNSKFTVGLIYRNKFISLCNEIAGKGKRRPGGRKSYSKSKRTYDDPNRNRYEKLKDNIKLREEQINKLPKLDSERKFLENELDNYKRALKRMKDKYQFEHIINFQNFTLIK